MVKDKKEVFICVTTVSVVTAVGFLSSYSSSYAAAVTAMIVDYLAVAETMAVVEIIIASGLSFFFSSAAVAVAVLLGAVVFKPKGKYSGRR